MFDGKDRVRAGRRCGDTTVHRFELGSRGLESSAMGGGSDISFLSNLRVPCAIILVLFFGLLVLLGSCLVSRWG